MNAKTTTVRLVLSALLASGVAACTGEMSTGDEPQLPGDNSAGGEDNTFDHEGTTLDPFALLDKLRQEGPPRYASRVHSCAKMKYDTIGNLLASRGVNLAATGATSAGAMYRSGDQALGAPNYAARQRESRELTTATASKLFDIFVQAAPEIIANMPNRPECTVAGVPAQMFNSSGQCDLDGITCLLGVPATASHLELCNLTVQQASDPAKGKLIAVATLLAAANTCE